jgi:hypothetical protein
LLIGRYIQYLLQYLLIQYLIYKVPNRGARGTDDVHAANHKQPRLCLHDPLKTTKIPDIKDTRDIDNSGDDRAPGLQGVFTQPAFTSLGLADDRYHPTGDGSGNGNGNASSSWGL